MTTIFVVEDDYEATRFANGLKCLGVDISLEEDKTYVVRP